MGIQIGAKPDSGFDDPIGMLTDCHRRIEKFLHILCIVAERAQDRALTAEEVAAVEAALRYFPSGGERHTADEEESLFPRLRQAGAQQILEELERLENDHQTAGNLHATVESLFSEWIAVGSLKNESRKQLLFATGQLRQLYDAHIQVEEKIVFPHASHTLDPKAITAIGGEFHARRA